MNTAQAVVAMLRREGIAELYCLPGIQNDPLFDALYHEPAIRPIHTRHEQGAAYMALGAAMATGRTQAYCVVPGPGFLNTTAALATAYACNAPVLALVGQIPMAAIGRGLGLLHEIPDQLGVMASLTKWAARIQGPADVVPLMQQGFRALRSGRPRPVGIEVPMDVWARGAAVALPDGPTAAEPAALDDDAIESAARLLGASTSPLIVVGGGAQHASAEVSALADLLQAPVVANRTGKGVVDSRRALSVGAPVGHHLWPQADVVLAIGTRLQTQQMNWGVDERLAVVRIDADPTEIDRIRPATVGIVGDAAQVAARLLERVAAHNRRRGSRQDELRALKAAFFDRYETTLRPQMDYLRAIREMLPEDGIFVDELTQLGFVSRFAFPVYRPRTFLSTAYQGTLGWGFATALGAKVACPDRAVVAIAGDGGFLFNVQELASAVRHRIGVVALVFNDGAFGNVRRIQQEQFGNRLIASELTNPDFVKLAESFGVAATRADSPPELRAALARALAAGQQGQPTLIEVRCGEMPSPWAFVNLPRVRPVAATMAATMAAAATTAAAADKTP